MPLTRLSLNAAQRRYRYLDVLTTLSDEAVKALCANPQVILPDKFKQ
jgi:hypothetical protein